MDVLNFFGLKEDPFTLTPDPSYFYPSSSHNEGLLLMDYAIDQREGFLLIIGEPGTGKTTLLKVFLEKWRDNAEIAIILTPRLSPEEFLIAVAEDLKIPVKRKHKNEIIKSLRNFMMKKVMESKRVIIIVDEAQNLPAETLEELRLLSNLETDKEKLLQIILLGQPELEVKLMKDNLRQLNQRITTRVYLKKFHFSETVDYIHYRAAKAGRKNLHIDKKAGKVIHDRSKGTPRLINMLLSRSLMAAYLEESNRISPKHVQHAIKSLNHSDMRVQRPQHLIHAVMGISAILLLAAFPLIHPKSILKDSVTKATEETPSVTGGENTVDDSGSHQHGIEGAESNSSLRKLASVKTDTANIRYNPSLDARIAGWSAKGNLLVVVNETVDDENRKWYQVIYKDQKRWISGAVIDIAETESM